MNKPRLVKREEIQQQPAKAAPAPAKPSITKQLKLAILERAQSKATTTTPTAARAAFAALFATA